MVHRGPDRCRELSGLCRHYPSFDLSISSFCITSAVTGAKQCANSSVRSAPNSSSCQILARPEPDRRDFCQAQAPAPTSFCANCRYGLRRNWPRTRCLLGGRVRQLSQKFTISSLMSSRFNAEHAVRKLRADDAAAIEKQKRSIRNYKWIEARPMPQSSSSITSEPAGSDVARFGHAQLS